MATPAHRRELVLDNGRVFVEAPRLMSACSIRRSGARQAAQAIAADDASSAIATAGISEAQAALISVVH
jgi:hypothetical protein